MNSRIYLLFRFIHLIFGAFFIISLFFYLLYSLITEYNFIILISFIGIGALIYGVYRAFTKDAIPLHPLCPFYLTDSQKEECKKITNSTDSEILKAIKIFDWMQKNIQYEFEVLKEDKKTFKDILRPSRNAASVFQDKRGVCGDMARLYIAMARYSGVHSVYFAYIEIDHTGEKVNHACAIYKNNKGIILIDPAYEIFYVKHKKYYVQSDLEVRLNIMKL